MSAEAPKEAGTPAPVTPREPEGGLSRFLNKLFGEPSALQPTLRIVQPPPGLEGFAAKIQQGIDGHLAAVSQQELERQNAEAARLAAEVAEKAQAVATQRELEQKRGIAMAEARQILDEFQIEEKLRFIQKTVWGGKGKIRSIEPKFGIYPMGFTAVGVDEYDELGGIELVRQYQLPVFHESMKYGSSGDDGGPYYSWQYVSETSGTSISIVVLKQIGSWKGEKILRVGSKYSAGQRNQEHFGYYYSTYHEHYSIGQAGSFPDVNIPVGSRDSKALLDLALEDETNYRLANNLVPSELEERARIILAEAKRRPSWQRWTSNVHDL